MKAKIIIIILVSIFLVGIIYTFTRTGNSNTTDNNSLPKVAVSFAPITDIVAQVGGNKINTIQIIPSGSSPHTYEPLPSDQEKLAGTKLAFVIGLDLDSWADDMLQAAAPDAKIVSLDQGITLLNSTETYAPEGISSQDPHYWLSYSNAKIMVQTITSALEQLDPANSNYFKTNAENYIAAIDQARTAAQAKVAKLTDKDLITFHAAFQYFAQDLGFNVVASIEPYAGSDPSPQYLAQIGDLIKQYKIKTLFKEPELSDDVVTALAQDYGAKVLTLDPEGSLKSNYLDMMAYNVDTIVTAYGTSL